VAVNDTSGAMISVTKGHSRLPAGHRQKGAQGGLVESNTKPKVLKIGTGSAKKRKARYILGEREIRKKADHLLAAGRKTGLMFMKGELGKGGPRASQTSDTGCSDTAGGMGGKGRGEQSTTKKQKREEKDHET